VKRGLVLVEGQTEEQFVNHCLAPHLIDQGLALTATIVNTKRPVGRPHFKGGATSYGKVNRDLQLLLYDSDASVITTVLDYYALPSDFPGMADRPAGPPERRVGYVEAAWGAAVGDRRFVPHLTLHEFEAWIYADPARLEAWMFDDDPMVIPRIAEIAAEYASAEHIDDGVETAPSKRLRRLFRAYDKTVHGPLAVRAIGIDRIRATCSHFSAWLRQLETIAAA
jgi:hypothetical protein